uniref:Uncharacterized protein AlNc14C122G6695 n=1 Tax=Albugo laibachii Nc14 TaxID=890382 RepID=F0WJG9_9STRA|nr:conserved hypothetical protein [Albugo laibachii Nc14]|eukprot:CCA21418.1 conserved hypothetical protein [Albugo laibachii Nc14]
MENSIRNKLHEPQSNDSRYYSPDKIRSLVQEKEKELHEINEFRIHSLEGLICDKESENAILKQKLVKLQEDFQYNLKLLEGRDEELAQYDNTFMTLKKQSHCQAEEISELKASMAELRSELTREKKNVQAKETEIQIRSKEFRIQLEEFNWSYEDRIKQLEKSLDQNRQHTERLIDQKNEDFEAERIEWKQNMDQLVRDQKSQHENQVEECETKLTQLKMEWNKAQTDCEVWKKRSKQLQDKVQELEKVGQQYEKDQKAIIWQLDDLKFVKNAEVDDLKKERTQLQQQKQSVLNEYEGRMAEALDQLYTMENALEQQKLHHTNELAREIQQMEEQARCQKERTEDSINSLKTQLQAEQERNSQKESEQQRVRWELEDKVRIKEGELEEMLKQLHETNSSHAISLQDLTEKRLESEKAQERMQSRLGESLAQLQAYEDSTKKLRNQIEAAHEEEEELRQQLVAQNLSWERKMQDTEQESRMYQGARVRELQQDNDGLVNEKKALKEKLCHTEIEVQRLQTELFTVQANQHVADTFTAPLKSSISRTDGKLFSFDSTTGRNNWGSLAPQILSPLWSGDLGPPTISSLPDKMKSQEKRYPAMDEDQDGSNKITSVKNEMISKPLQASGSLTFLFFTDMIREMKEAITEQVEKNTWNREEINAAGRDHDKGALQSLTESNSLLKNEINVYKCQLSEANRIVVEKHVQIAELERKLSLQKEELRASPSQLKSLQNEVLSLRKSLTAANADIERLAAERIQLMDLSNQLSAEARRHKERSSDASSGLQTEVKDRNDYEALIEDLMQSLEECRQHNKILKKELRRMIKIQRQKMGTVHDFSPSMSKSIHENPTSDVPAFSKEARMSNADGNSSPTDFDSCLIERRESRASHQSHRSQKDGDARKLNVCNSLGGDRNSESTQNAEAREVRMSARATLSQQHMMKKLQQLQSKRAELFNDRTNVRNYNIK